MITASPRPADAPTVRFTPNRPRRAWGAFVAVLVGWSAYRAGLDVASLVNPAGWGQVSDFFSAALRPRLDADFVRLAFDEALVTVAYAVLGTALSIVIGLAGAIVLAERSWRPLARNRHARSIGWPVSRVAFAVPRSMHEVVFGLLLVNVLGLDPLVAVLSIGVPFGAVTAKVFAELVDEVRDDAEGALRAAGAPRLVALAVGVAPMATGDLLSYAFYRFECAIRSAAVLGIIGAGGLGFQIALSFQSLRYDEMWTFMWALVLISGLADRWSGAVRRRRSTVAAEHHVFEGVSPGPPRRDRFVAGSGLAYAAAIPLAWWWAGVDVTTLWSDRTRRLAGELAEGMWPPQIGRGGWSQLLADVADTVALSVLALAAAWTLACLVAFAARRPDDADRRRAVTAAVARFVLLVARAVPPPVWAFIAVFVFLPGLWPGAIALALYNLGVLGRLQAEVVENLDPTPAEALRAIGAGRTATALHATTPMVAGRFVALGLYRWEVAIRETVIVGVVGAAGLGRRMAEQWARFDHDGITATVLALVAVTVLVDLTSASIRRSVR